MAKAEDAKVLATIAAAPELATPDATDAFLNAMPIAGLASMWCVLQRLSRRDQTAGAWAAKLYFDHLPHAQPDRALDLAFEVLRTEADKPTVMQLNDKFMLSLLYAQGAEVIDRIEAEATDNEKLRWLLGEFTSDLASHFRTASARSPTPKAGRPTMPPAAGRSSRSMAGPCRSRHWRGPGSSNIRNRIATATTIISP